MKSSKINVVLIACFLAVVIVLTNVVTSLSVQNSKISFTGSIAPLASAFGRLSFGVGPEEWNALESLNGKYGTNMTIATSWINSRQDLYGWWTNSFFPGSLWNVSCIPHIITWGYFAHSWGVDYSSDNLSLYRQTWLNDLKYLAARLKAPNDGKHNVLVSLETEFSSYKNINYTYWNQLMLDSREAIKQIAPNVLVSYSFGGWEWRSGDVSLNGTLTESMQKMDFLSFGCMWGVSGNSQQAWLNGDDLKAGYAGVNWTKRFGDKPHVWDYMIDDIIGNIKALAKFNSHVLLDHFCIDHHLWGLQSQVDVVREMSNNSRFMKDLGLFGISWMGYRDSKWDEPVCWLGDIGGKTCGLEYPDASVKPCLSVWTNLVNSAS